MSDDENGFFLKNKNNNNNNNINNFNNNSEINIESNNNIETFLNKKHLNDSIQPQLMDHQHYYNDVIRDAGETGRQASRIFFERTFNNWIKAILINKICNELGNSDEKNLSVLDLCCGRGGDLKKYFITNKVKLFVGSDLSEKLLQNAMERLKRIKEEKKNNWKLDTKCIFITEDLSSPQNRLLEKIDKQFYFDLVSCQFALHYHFQCEERIRAFLKNVTSRLCDGGYFFGTIIDDNVIVKKLRNPNYNGNIYKDKKYYFGNEFYRINFKNSHFNKKNGPYGIEYGFYLEDSIDKRDEKGNIESVGEYLIIFKEFIKLCQEFDLYLIENKNFTKFYKDNINIPTFKKMFNNMVKDLDSSTIKEQWEIIHLYQIFIFRKGKSYVEKNEQTPKYVPYLSKVKYKFKDFEPIFIKTSFD